MKNVVKNVVKKRINERISQLEKSGESKDSIGILKQVLKDLKNIDFQQFAEPSKKINKSYEEVLSKIDDDFKGLILLLNFYHNQLEEVSSECLSIFFFGDCEKCSGLSHKFWALVDILVEYLNKSFSICESKIHLVGFREGWVLVKVDQEKKIRYERRMKLINFFESIIDSYLIRIIPSDKLGEFNDINHVIEEGVDRMIEEGVDNHLKYRLKEFFSEKAKEIFGPASDGIVKTFNKILDNVDLLEELGIYYRIIETVEVNFFIHQF